MGVLATQANRILQRALPAALQAIADDTTAYIRDEISFPCPVYNGNPVQVTTRGGVHHDPQGVGPPYRESGALLAGISSSIAIRKGEEAVVTIKSSRNGSSFVPKQLEFGHPSAPPYPYMRPARNRMAARAPEILRDHLGAL